MANQYFTSLGSFGVSPSLVLLGGMLTEREQRYQSICNAHFRGT
jgi:hypothetical protein